VTPEKIRKAMESGLAMVCATCVKYWRGQDSPLALGKCTARGTCGSPIGGDAFSEYEGPLTKDKFLEWCFVCAAESDYAVRVRGKERLVGICKAHVHLLHELVPKSREANPEELLIKDGGTLLTLTELTGPRRKTLLQAMVDTEREWAAEAAVE
jgi:hypothetical protein